MADVAHVEQTARGRALVLHGVRVPLAGGLSPVDVSSLATQINAAARPEPARAPSKAGRLADALATLRQQIAELDRRLARDDLDPRERALLDRQLGAMCTHAEALEGRLELMAEAAHG